MQDCLIFALAEFAPRRSVSIAGPCCGHLGSSARTRCTSTSPNPTGSIQWGLLMHSPADVTARRRHVGHVTRAVMTLAQDISRAKNSAYQKHCEEKRPDVTRRDHFKLLRPRPDPFTYSARARKHRAPLPSLFPKSSDAGRWCGTVLLPWSPDSSRPQSPE